MYNWCSTAPPTIFACMADRPCSFFETLCHEGDLQEINDFIALGSARAAHDAMALKRFRITHVLTVHPNIPFKFEKSITYLRIPLPDAPFEILAPHIPEVLDFLDNVKRKNGRVLVHCQKGISRSAAFVFVYLMRRENLSFEEAFELVERKRKQAFPNVGFQAQLIKNCRKDMTPEEISADVLAKVHDRFADATAYVDIILKNGGVALTESKGKWKSLGLFFENLHKYKFVPRGGDEEKLRTEALETVTRLQNLQKVFAPSMEGVKLTKNLAQEIESWIAVIDEHRAEEEGSSAAADKKTHFSSKKDKKKKHGVKKKEKKKKKKKEKKPKRKKDHKACSPHSGASSSSSSVAR